MCVANIVDGTLICAFGPCILKVIEQLLIASSVELAFTNENQVDDEIQSL